MDPDEELLTGKRASSRAILVSTVVVLLLATGGVAFWYVRQYAREGQEVTRVEQASTAASACVASVRGDAPEAWGLERALEHMSRMERVTRDGEDPTTSEERERFETLASDAATGCHALGTLNRMITEEHSGLYLGVPANLAQPPDQDDPERWFRRILPKSREEVLEMTRRIRLMAAEINTRREERALMAYELPVEGRGPSELARVIELAPLPFELRMSAGDREPSRTEVWPLGRFVFVMRRASIARVPCDTRFINRLSCFNEFVQTVSWEGEVSEVRALERPSSVLYWSAFAPTGDGSLWAVGVNRNDDAIVGRYAPDSTTPMVARIDARVDGSTNIVTVVQGVAVFPSDGSAWFRPSTQDEDDLEFEVAESTPAPLVISATHGGAARGIDLEHVGRLSLFGSEEDGFTSRLVGPEGDVLLRVIESNTRVREIAALRALNSGKAVALLQRFDDGPDAIAVTTDFGSSWLAAASP